MSPEELELLAHTPLNGHCKTEPSAILLDDVYQFIGRFVSYPSDHTRVAHTLWIAHTHLMEAWETTPRLAFLSPEPASGKTRALEVTELLVPNPIEAVNMTAAYVFRKVAADPENLPTLLHDEIDTIFGDKAREHEDVRALINAGHRRGAVAGRCVVKGKTIETEELPAYCAVALAGLGNLPDTILTRSIIIRMRRRAPTELVTPYRRREHAPEGHALRDRLAAWAIGIRPSLNLRPAMPPEITDRDADCWESLLSIAETAGVEWADRARVTAVTLITDTKVDRGSLGVRLLADLRTVFGETDRLATVDLLEKLYALDEAPWSDLKGKPLDPRRLSLFLKPYGVSRKTFKISDKTFKGYERADFLDAWSRYLPLEEPQSSPGKKVTRVTEVTKKEPERTSPSPQEPVTAVTPVTRETQSDSDELLFEEGEAHVD